MVKIQNKKQTTQWMLMFGFMCILFLRYYESMVSAYNTTILAFSYKYGFISRGFLGTVYALLDKIMPMDMMQYIWVLRFTQLTTALFYLFFFFVLFFFYKKTADRFKDETFLVAAFWMMFTVPMFCSSYNMGRPDMYCLTLSLISILLIIKEKALWLIVVFASVGVMIHQGNVFMFLGVVLALLLFKGMGETGQRQKKYFLIFLMSFLFASALFLWFEFFSHANGESVYQEISQLAQQISTEEYHKDLIDAEILGIDLTDREITYHHQNMVEFPIFAVLMMPYILLIAVMFGKMIRSCDTKWEKFRYIILLIGAGTILPDMILKVDYGRWMYVVISYYAMVILYLLATKDKRMEEVLIWFTEKRKCVGSAAILLLVYPLVFQPLQHTWISEFTKQLAEFLNNNLLHMW